MTNAPLARIGDSRDIESTNHFAEAIGRGEDPHAVLEDLRTMGRDNARTPMQWDGSAHAGFTTGTPLGRREPEPHRDQRESSGRGPQLRVPPLPRPHRAARRAGVVGG